MQVDLFTIIAQIVNFLILVWLLKRFLYGRIVRAMDEREERIAEEIREAEEARSEAEKRAREYRERQEGIESERDEILAKAREEAEERKREMLDDARSDVEERRARWRKSLREEKENFLQGLRERLAEEALAVARKAVREVADADIEAGAVPALERALRSADDETVGRFRNAVEESDGRVSVESANELGEDQRKRVRDLVAEVAGEDVATEFRVEPSHVLGIVLTTEGFRLGWTAADYIDELRERVADELEDVSDAETGERGEKDEENEKRERDRKDEEDEKRERDEEDGS